MIRVTFLGTAAACPTAGRNVSAISVHRGGDSLRGSDSILLDCGEGTQRQIMRFGTGFSFAHIFVTHGHTDHFLGLPGLLRTMGLQGRSDPMTIHAPHKMVDLLNTAVGLGIDRLAFPCRIRGLGPGERVSFAGWAIHAFEVDHGIAALGYALIEEPRPGRFDVATARRLGIPEGPLFGQLHRGEPVEVEGRVIRPEEVVGPPRPGRKIVYTGDTRPARTTGDIARGADLLVHDATFAGNERKRARETRHSTVIEAAQLAQRSRVRRLALTHISARYADRPRELEDAARGIFPGAMVAHDGMRIEIGLDG